MPERARSRRALDEDTIDLRSQLRIDDDDLDQCLVQQPDLFYQAAMSSTEANAIRDGLKLELKEVLAELDGDIRRRLAETNERATEGAISNELQTLPRIKTLNRDILAASKRADAALILKESFIQRSYALKDLTAIQLSRFYNLNVERGATNVRRGVGDRVQDEASRLRDQRNRERR